MDFQAYNEYFGADEKGDWQIGKISLIKNFSFAD